MRHWSRRGAIAWLLWPVGLAFGAIAFLRRLAYRLGVLRRERAGLPVIVVGNLSVGGSGKTPLVLHVVRLLQQAGWKPGIVSRGYVPGRAAEKSELPVEASLVSDPARVGDEPLLLARRGGCPVWVAADRPAACRALRSAHPECDVIVTDDGLQHYALARDIEICVVDARSLGNRLLFPAGPLREPLARLRSVSALVRHGAVADMPSGSLPVFDMQLQGGELVNLANAADRRPVRDFAGQKVHAIAGIGNPERFFLQLSGFGLQVLPHHYPDHHAFRAEDLDFGDGLPVVMTEKDAVKCKRFLQPRYWVFPVSASLDPAFGRWLLERLGGPKAA